MKKYYDIENGCSIEKTSSGYYEVVINESRSGNEYKYLFPTKEKAMEEILSYLEIDGEEE